MKLRTTDGQVYDLDSLPDSIEETQSLFSEYRFTISSQLKTCLFYHNLGQDENCVNLLKWCVQSCMFDKDESDLLKLTLMAFYIETQTYKEECTKLFSSLEGTRYKDILDLIKGYFFFFQKKYDTAQFLLKNDTTGKNLIYLSTNQPDKVETKDILLSGYKHYLLNDMKNAEECFKMALKDNKNVLSYLIRINPGIYLNSSLCNEKVKNSLENQLTSILSLRNEEQKITQLNDLFDKNESIKSEFFYEKGKMYHLKKDYEKALENYILSDLEVANYQIKRITGTLYQNNEELSQIYNLKCNYLKKDVNPVKEFFILKKIRKYIDECTYLNNRGYFLYFINEKNNEIINEVINDFSSFKEKLSNHESHDSFDFYTKNEEEINNIVLHYFKIAKFFADSEQLKAISYNIEMIEKNEKEKINEDLEYAILNVNKSPEKSKKIFLKYLKENRVLSSNLSRTIGRGIGICLALEGDPFCEKIFEYFGDEENLKIFNERKEIVH